MYTGERQTTSAQLFDDIHCMNIFSIVVSKKYNFLNVSLYKKKT